MLWLSQPETMCDSCCVCDPDPVLNCVYFWELMCLTLGDCMYVTLDYGVFISGRFCARLCMMLCDSARCWVWLCKMLCLCVTLYDAVWLCEVLSVTLESSNGLSLYTQQHHRRRLTDHHHHHCQQLCHHCCCVNISDRIYDYDYVTE